MPTLSQKIELVANLLPAGEARTQLDALVSEADASIRALTNVIAVQQRHLHALQCAVAGLCVYCEKPATGGDSYELSGITVPLCSACSSTPRSLIAAKLGLQ